MKNYLDTVASQYANSPILLALIKDFNDWIDPSANIDAFFEMVWDVDTATGYGLDVWGRIVGVSRQLVVTQTTYTPAAILTYFGFNGSGAQPFNQSPFFGYSGPTPPATSTTTTLPYALSDDAYRILILTKALANISASSAPAINAQLTNLFPGRGPCFALDGGSMSMAYVFEFLLTPVEMAIVANSGAIGRPAGVRAVLIEVDAPHAFGFAGSGLQPFNQGTFFQGVINVS